MTGTKITNSEYAKVHKWIVEQNGKASHCAISKYHFSPSGYHWANVSGEYQYDLADWISLCPACHRRLDQQFINKEGSAIGYRRKGEIVVRMNIYLPPPIATQAKVLAAKMNISVSHLVEGLIAGAAVMHGATENKE